MTPPKDKTDYEKKKIIAARIGEARKMAGLSQGQVAKMLGISRPSLSEAEGGNRNVTATELSRLAEIYDVNVSWLIGVRVKKLDLRDDKLHLAAREIKKLLGKPEDLDKFLTILASLRDQEDDQ